MIPLIKIEISEDEARLYREFCKRYAFMKLMEDRGVFEIRDGSAEVHFDREGRIAKIDIHSHYRLS